VLAEKDGHFATLFIYGVGWERDDLDQGLGEKEEQDSGHPIRK